MSVGSMVLVTWEDAVSVSDWLDKKAARREDLQKCQTLGWLFLRDDRRIIVAGDRHVGGQKNVGGLTTIPIWWVLDVQAVSVVEPKSESIGTRPYRGSA